MKYRVTAEVRGSAYIGEVEADSLEDAFLKAEDLAAQHNLKLCHQCARRAEDLELGELSIEQGLGGEDSAAGIASR